MDGSPTVTADNWSGVTGSNYVKMDQPWDAMAINQQSAEEAYARVLKNVGATLPKRDSVDTRIIEEVRTGTATFEGSYKTKNPVAFRRVISLCYFDQSISSHVIESDEK